MRPIVMFLAVICLPTLLVRSNADEIKCRCATSIEKAAIQAAKEFSTREGLTIPKSIVGETVAEVLKAVCERKDLKPDCSDGAKAAGTTVDEYLSGAFHSGTPANLHSLVMRGLGGPQGLGRPDHRSYGRLSLTCQPEFALYTVEIEKEKFGNCGGIFLIKEGSIDLRVLDSHQSVACLGTVTVEAAKRANCTCTIGAEDSSVPFPIQCKGN